MAIKISTPPSALKTSSFQPPAPRPPVPAIVRPDTFIPRATPRPLVNIGGFSPPQRQDPLAQLQLGALRTAQAELGSGDRNEVEEPPNRGAAPDKYNTGLMMGIDWCGSFVEWSYKQNGFKHTDVFTSNVKTEAFFTEAGSGRTWTPAVADVNSPLYKTAAQYDIRPGDVAVFTHNEDQSGHVAIVESYDPKTGKLVLIEGNVDWADDDDADGFREEGIERRTYYLPQDADILEGFGRPVLSDFDQAAIDRATNPAPGGSGGGGGIWGRHPIPI